MQKKPLASKHLSCAKNGAMSVCSTLSICNYIISLKLEKKVMQPTDLDCHSGRREQTIVSLSSEFHRNAHFRPPLHKQPPDTHTLVQIKKKFTVESLQTDRTDRLFIGGEESATCKARSPFQTPLLLIEKLLMLSFPERALPSMNFFNQFLFILNYVHACMSM